MAGMTTQLRTRRLGRKTLDKAKLRDIFLVHFSITYRMSAVEDEHNFVRQLTEDAKS